MFKKRLPIGHIWRVALGLGVLGWAITALADCPDPSTRRYTVSIISNKHHNQISIAEPMAPPRHLVLRNGLMPEVHYLPDGRHALLTTQDAWVIRLDLAQARSVAEVRVGQSVRSVALSGQRITSPSVLAVANAVPNTLVLLDENLQTLKVLKVADKTGLQPTTVALVRTAQARSSFVASLQDLAELWEISYNPTAPEIAMGMVHDFQYREGSFVPGYLNVQRISLPTPAREFVLTNEGHEVLSAHPKSGPDGPANPAVMQVTHLDVRGKVAEFNLPQWPVSTELMKRTYGEADCSGLAK